jgi:sirohydrochlorin cobaltochelatase
MLTLGQLVAKTAAHLAVETGFLELSDPPAGVALDRLAARGLTRTSVVPLMLNPAGHAKSDVPAVLLDGRLRHPHLDLHYGRPLGTDHAVLALGTARIAEVGGFGVPLLVLARGTSDPDANGDAYKVARLLAEMSGAPLVEVGFSGVTWPRVPDALDLLQRKGARRIVCLAWFLCTGILVDRLHDDCARFAHATGIDVLRAGHLGPHPDLVPLILARHEEALGGDIRMNCDACSYRKPFPGLEARVGQPVGQGHSHLAAEHRAHGHPH